MKRLPLNGSEKKARKELKKRFARAGNIRFLNKHVRISVLLTAFIAALVAYISSGSDRLDCFSFPLWLLVFIFIIIACFDIRRYVLFRKRLGQSLRMIHAHGDLVRAAAETDRAKVVRYEKYLRETIEWIICDDYFYSGLTGEALYYEDILWYYYMQDEDHPGEIGRLTAYTADTEKPYEFYICTDDADGTAKLIMDRIVKCNPKAIYGEHSKAAYESSRSEINQRDN